jgi:hypothetical protein
MAHEALQQHLAALAKAHPGEHPFTLALRLQVAKLLEDGGQG